MGVHRRDIERWCPMHGDMADDIAFFECLAQVVLFHLRTGHQDVAGGVVCQASDNQITVAGCRSRLSTAEPMAQGLQALSFWESKRDVKAGSHPSPYPP